jgi:hypothetical protein
MTKSELKELIRECLHEELAKTHAFKESIDYYKNRLTQIANSTARKIISDGWYTDYDDESTLYNEVFDFVREILYSDNQDNYIHAEDYEFIKDEVEVAGIRNKNAYGGGKYEFDYDFCDAVANQVIYLSKYNLKEILV